MFESLKWKRRIDKIREMLREKWFLRKQVENGNIEGEWKVFKQAHLKCAETVYDDKSLSHKASEKRSVVKWWCWHRFTKYICKRDTVTPL